MVERVYHLRKVFLTVGLLVTVLALVGVSVLVHAYVQVAHADRGSNEIWRPALDTSWQWQLSDLPVDQSIDVDMYDIDLFDNEADVVEALHAQGKHVVCYMNAGAWEAWRPGADKFPSIVKGEPLEGWPDERWLDIRQISVLRPLIEARMDLCKAKGFDGIEPDNMDGYANESGFPLTYQDQLAFNIFLAEAAHARGLSIGLKNNVEQVEELLSYFDWTLNEECFRYEECEALLPFVKAGKPVFQVEYDLPTGHFCSKAHTLNFNSMKKNLSLDAYRVPCPHAADARHKLLLPLIVRA